MVCGMGLRLARNDIVMGNGGGAVDGDETLNDSPQSWLAVLFAAVVVVAADVGPR